MHSQIISLAELLMCRFHAILQVTLTAVVYEKQNHLRMMMKMHGLSDSAYWMITYFYYVTLFCVYMICFIIFGSLARKPSSLIYGMYKKVVFFFINSSWVCSNSIHKRPIDSRANFKLVCASHSQACLSSRRTTTAYKLCSTFCTST